SSPLHGWTADPWLPFPPGAHSLNVAAQVGDPTSMLHFTRRLLALRRATPALHAGEFALVGDSPSLLAWERRDPSGDRWFTYVNPTDEVHDSPDALIGATVVMCTDPESEGTEVTRKLPARVAFLAHRPATM
ncbi:MAG: DUF3459 domain-containing protein, partial [Actinomycetota bacterium]|nr:DUF3459 domain-containing protein [Actinomycetota bacterium]